MINHEFGERRRDTISRIVITCTTSPRWLRVSLRTVATPRLGCERDGVNSTTSLTTVSLSPGRLGHTTRADDAAFERKA
jgi:hypothetical protein